MSSGNERRVNERRVVYIKVLVNTDEIQLQAEREIFGATHVTHESEPVFDFGCLHQINRRDETNADTLFNILDEERPFKNWIYLEVEALPLPKEKRTPDDEMANLMDADLIQRYPSPPNKYFYDESQNEDVDHPQQNVKEKLQQLWLDFKNDADVLTGCWWIFHITDDSKKEDATSLAAPEPDTIAPNRQCRFNPYCVSTKF
jgi:hypothetical protein